MKNKEDKEFKKRATKDLLLFGLALIILIVFLYLSATLGFPLIR